MPRINYNGFTIYLHVIILTLFLTWNNKLKNQIQGIQTLLSSSNYFIQSKKVVIYSSLHYEFIITSDLNVYAKSLTPSKSIWQGSSKSQPVTYIGNEAFYFSSLSSSKLFTLGSLQCLKLVYQQLMFWGTIINNKWFAWGHVVFCVALLGHVIVLFISY